MVLLIVLALTLGYAVLFNNLNITGLGHIKKTTWNIYFDNVVILDGEDLVSVKPTTSGTNTTSLNYAVNFNVPWDTFRFNVDVVNNGTMDAMISLINNTNITTN